MVEVVADQQDQFIPRLLAIVDRDDVEALESHLSLVNNAEVYLNRTYNRARKQQCTPLMIACLNKSGGMIRTMLRCSKPDLEVSNDIELNENDQETWKFTNVTVLWAAAAVNNFDLVKLLIEHGAKVNHTTQTNSTALRCACCNGNLEMARYLVEHGADTHIAKIHNETNLIASVFNNDLHMTTYLVDTLAYDVNECLADGRSPLYVAVDRESLEHVLFLLDHDARHFPAEKDYMSPIVLAAEKRRTDLVYAIAPRCALLEQIEAEEVLGSAFACGEYGDVDLEKCLLHLCRAMELRLEHQLPKLTRQSTIEAFNHRQECQTIDQLNALRAHRDHIYTEALLVRERLLGSSNIRYLHSLRYRGAALADTGQHYRGIAHWLYELELHRQYSIPNNVDDTRQWASIFSDIVHVHSSMPFVAWQTVIAAIVEELDRQTIDFDFHLHTLLFLITTASQILFKTMISEDDRQVFYRSVSSVVQRHYVTQTCGSSLLHLSLNRCSSANDYFINRNCIYPCLHTARMLLQCGADVNMINAARDTPLHVLVADPSVVDETIIELLYSAGAHVDCVNTLGETPMDGTTNAITRQFLGKRTKLSLKCLCARFIRKNDIPFRDKIHTALIMFVEKH